MPIGPKHRRCRNCNKLFVPKYQNQFFHSPQCRADYHNNGKTPEARVLAILRRTMKRPEFQKLMRETVKKTVREEFQALAARGAEMQDRNSVSKSISGRPADASSTNP
jgi:hypothetical protein